PDRPRLEAGCQPVSPGDVAGEDAGGQPVRRVVRPGNDLVLAVERKHRHDRTEDLVGDDLHVVGAVGEDRRLDEVSGVETVATGASATGDDPGSGSSTGLDVAENLVHVL